MLGWWKKLFGSVTPGSGLDGERRAAQWLRRERGYSIVAQNWRNPADRRDEIDLVCRDGEVLVFVEVKARSAAALVPGVYAVDARKKRVVERAARAYLAGLREKPRTFRFDIVEVTFPGKSGLANGVEAKGAPAPAGAPPSTAEPSIQHFQNVTLFAKTFRG